MSELGEDALGRLGRGPAIFHISQDKIDETMLRAEMGSRGFLHLVQGWIKVASLYVFEDPNNPRDSQA